MQIDFSEDQEQFREVVSRFLRDKSPPSAVRRLLETEKGYDAQVWKQLCEDIGLAGTHIPETYGGFGYGAVELGIVCEEMGRHLYCGPFFASSVMASYALLNGGEEEHKLRLLPNLAIGSAIATLVLDSLEEPDRVGSELSLSHGALNGVAPIVIDAQVADLLIVVAQSEGRLGLFEVPANADGLEISAQSALDPTRRLSKVELEGVEAEQIGILTQESLHKTWDEICVALAHEMIGGAQRLFDTTVDYTKMRVQFGRPIGSFQALKHRCADMLVELEFTKAAVQHAAFSLASGEGDPYTASMAKAMAGDTYMHLAKEAIQMRGGIGFTWEEDTHFWYKRAKASEVLMGPAHVHRERIVQLMEDAA